MTFKTFNFNLLDKFIYGIINATQREYPQTLSFMLHQKNILLMLFL